jgi:hypothetical protein
MQSAFTKVVVSVPVSEPVAALGRLDLEAVPEKDDRNCCIAVRSACEIWRASVYRNGTKTLTRSELRHGQMFLELHAFAITMSLFVASNENVIFVDLFTVRH